MASLLWVNTSAGPDAAWNPKRERDRRRHVMLDYRAKRAAEHRLSSYNALQTPISESSGRRVFLEPTPTRVRRTSAQRSADFSIAPASHQVASSSNAAEVHRDGGEIEHEGTGRELAVQPSHVYSCTFDRTCRCPKCLFSTKCQADYAIFQAAMARKAVDNNPRGASIHRGVLFERFIGALDDNIVSSRKFILTRLWDWFTPRAAAMDAAQDCLLLTQLSLDLNDHRVRVEAMEKHSQAIRGLRRRLEQPVITCDDAMLGTIDALSLCDMWAETSPNGIEWRYHMRALCAIFAKVGPSGLKTIFARRTAISSVHLSLIDAMATRKAIVFGRPEWQVALHSWIASNDVHTLTAIASVLPQLLEELDQGTWSNDVEAKHELHSRLQTLNAAFQDWLQR